MSYAWKAGPSEPNERYVYLAIADNANDEGFAFPAIHTIISKTRLSESTVRRSINRLEATGWLEVERGKGKGNHSRYKLKSKSGSNLLPGAKGVTGMGKKCQGDMEKEPHRPAKGITVTLFPHPRDAFCARQKVAP